MIFVFSQLVNHIIALNKKEYEQLMNTKVCLLRLLDGELILMAIKYFKDIWPQKSILKSFVRKITIIHKPNLKCTEPKCIQTSG